MTNVTDLRHSVQGSVRMSSIQTINHELGKQSKADWQIISPPLPQNNSLGFSSPVLLLGLTKDAMCNSAFSTIDSGYHLTCLCKSLSLMLPPCFTRHAVLQGVTCRPPVMRWVSLGSNTTDQFDFWRKADLKPRSWIHVTTDPRKRLNLQTGIFSLVIFEIRQPPSIRWGCYLMIQYPTVFHSQWGRTAN